MEEDKKTKKENKTKEIKKNQLAPVNAGHSTMLIK